MSILRKRNKLIAAFLTLAIAASCFCIAPSAVAAQTDNVDIKAAAQGKSSNSLHKQERQDNTPVRRRHH